jgi:hypothetical protein
LVTVKTKPYSAALLAGIGTAIGLEPKEAFVIAVKLGITMVEAPPPSVEVTIEYLSGFPVVTVYGILNEVSVGNTSSM